MTISSITHLLAWSKTSATAATASARRSAALPPRPGRSVSATPACRSVFSIPATLG